MSDLFTAEDKKLAEKIFRFMGCDYYEAMGHKDNPCKPVKSLFDFPSARMFTIILAASYKNEASGKGFYCEMSRVELSRKLQKFIQGTTISDKLRFFAQYWFLMVDSQRFRQDSNGEWVRETQRIFPNEAFKLILNPGHAGLKKAFIKRSIEIGNNRDQGKQGFNYTVDYGYSENTTRGREVLNVGCLNEVIANKSEQAKERAEENKRWKDMGDRFVAAAAKVWIHGQLAAGFGDEKPTWHGPTATMTAAAKRERRELTKTFESFGGSVAGLAWLLYCNGTPELDEWGNPKFDRLKPHKQVVFGDKRPGQFAKNFNALIKDPEFIDFATDGWEDAKILLRDEFFGDLIDEEPREGHHRDRLGYSLGEKHRRPAID